MKRGLIPMLIILTMVSSHAQDTITEDNNCYIFYPHSYDLFLADSNSFISWAGNYWWENIASPGTMLYGVSLRGSLPLDSSVYAVLAIKEGNQYIFLDTAWYDSSVVYRYLKFRAVSNIHFGAEFDYVENCNEIYFHRPWQMWDTFYVVVCHSPLVSALQVWVGVGYVSGEPEYIQRWCYTREGDSIERPQCFYPRTGTTSSSGAPWGFEFPILEPNRTRCRRPSGLRMRERGNGWAVLQWNSGSGDSYRVTVEGPDDTVVYETADTTLRLDSLAPEAFYWVKLQSLCRYQHHSYDSTLLNPGVLQFGFRNLITGVSGADADLRVEVYPNPASGCLVLEAGDDSPVRAVLTDLGGREVMAVDFRATATLDVSRLAAGPYLLRLTTPTATTVRKVVVQ